MSAQPPDSTTSALVRRRRIRRWIVGTIVAVVLLIALRQAIDPYDERGYMAVPHGDHTHFVPRDRDQEVSISNFPVVYPGPAERILPDGRVVRTSP